MANLWDGTEWTIPEPKASFRGSGQQNLPMMAPRLTQAEREVVSLALKGWSNSRIAATRASSPRTVANQLANAYRKLEVGSRTDLYAQYGSQLGALDSLHSAA